jgi:hypothetical protein
VFERRESFIENLNNILTNSSAPGYVDMVQSLFKIEFNPVKNEETGARKWKKNRAKSIEFHAKDEIVSIKIHDETHEGEFICKFWVALKIQNAENQELNRDIVCMIDEFELIHQFYTNADVYEGAEIYMAVTKFVIQSTLLAKKYFFKISK